VSSDLNYADDNNTGFTVGNTHKLIPRR